MMTCQVSTVQRAVMAPLQIPPRATSAVLLCPILSPYSPPTPSHSPSPLTPPSPLCRCSLSVRPWRGRALSCSAPPSALTPPYSPPVPPPLSPLPLPFVDALRASDHGAGERCPALPRPQPLLPPTPSHSPSPLTPPPPPCRCSPSVRPWRGRALSCSAQPSALTPPYSLPLPLPSHPSPSPL